MIEPDEIVLRSMMHINVSKETQPFMEWLRKSLQSGYESTGQMEMPEAMFRQVQGGNACLDNIIKSVESAYDTNKARIVNKALGETAGKAL